MGYNLPSNTDYVSADHYNHCCERNPPSSEPGTDYGSAYGSPLYAPATGRVADLNHSNANATGRYLAIDFDDGRRGRSLHLSEVWVNVGDRVSQGQQVGKTGASGFGSDWGYGAHVHQTLWDYHGYNFCSSCTLDFEKYVGSAEPGPTQRVVGSSPANGRSDPSTANPATQQLPPGTLANFNGWIRGETVSGNNVWFRGEFSGDWFWSGGFTDQGTHDLTDLNPPVPAAGNERTVGPNSANGRSDPSTANPAIKSAAGNSVVAMNGWITGEAVEGNTVWFREPDGTFYWSGGFTDQGTHDLADLNQPDVAVTTRTVGTNPANIRDLPYTTSPAHSSADGGTVIDMSGFTHGDEVEGNDVWFQRAADDDWMWSGGFTSAATDGLTEKPAPNPPEPGDADNPRGLPVETGYQCRSRRSGWTRRSDTRTAPTRRVPTPAGATQAASRWTPCSTPTSSTGPTPAPTTRRRPTGTRTATAGPPRRRRRSTGTASRPSSSGWARSLRHPGRTGTGGRWRRRRWLSRGQTSRLSSGNSTRRSSRGWRSTTARC